MSVHMISWVLENSDATGSDRLVLIVLADHADKDGERSHPSVETIAREARLSKRAVQYSLRALEKNGSIQRDGYGSRGQANWTIFAPRTCCTPANHNGVGVQSTAQVTSQIAHEPSITVREPSKDVQRVWQAYLETTGKTRSVLDPKRQQRLVGWLKFYPVEDLVDAARGWRHDPFLRGENDRRMVYDKLETIFRDAGQIEKLRDLERGIGRPRDRTNVAEFLAR